MLLADWGARTHNSIGVSPGEPSMHLRWNDMRRDEALRLLAAHREEIARFGVKSLAIFGSVARDEAGPDSDVDVLVEFSVPVGLFTFLGLQHYLEDVLGRRVDLATPDALRDSMRDQILKEAVRAA